MQFDYFVVDGDLGGEKPCDTLVEKLLKLVVNFAAAQKTLFLQDAASCLNNH